MFRHRQQLRRWATRVLFFWLFGLGVGIANACLATGEAGPVAATVGHFVAGVGARHGEASHDHARADGPSLPAHHGSSSKANCQDFCDKATVWIPPLKSALDDIQFHAMTATTAVTVLPIPTFAPVRLWVPRRDGVRAPAIQIAFLRLAL